MIKPQGDKKQTATTPQNSRSSVKRLCWHARVTSHEGQSGSCACVSSEGSPLMEGISTFAHLTPHERGQERIAEKRVDNLVPPIIQGIAAAVQSRPHERDQKQICEQRVNLPMPPKEKIAADVQVTPHQRQILGFRIEMLSNSLKIPFPSEGKRSWRRCKLFHRSVCYSALSSSLSMSPFLVLKNQSRNRASRCVLSAS